jgi:hypothetical protein
LREDLFGFLPHSRTGRLSLYHSRVFDQIGTRMDAVKIQIKTNTMAGSAVFSLKCFNANTLPNPAFCIPISIDNALFFNLSNPASFPVR